MTERSPAQSHVAAPATPLPLNPSRFADQRRCDARLIETIGIAAFLEALDCDMMGGAISQRELKRRTTWAQHLEQMRRLDLTRPKVVTFAQRSPVIEEPIEQSIERKAET